MDNKNKIYIILFITFLAFGISIGIYMDTFEDMDDLVNIPLDEEFEIQELVDLRKANKDTRKEIKKLKSFIENYEQEGATENIVLKNLKTKVKEYRILAGYEDMIGPGVVITLESTLDENIAEIVEYRRYLISLVNELKMVGAEAISINNYRITSRSEITLAGRHINVNTNPIAPPYVIAAIGDHTEFERYVNYNTLLFELMQGDGIGANVEFKDEIVIPALADEKPMEYLIIKEEN
ncbi:MAG: DUF881 domain-containing protein [Clostridiales bacterium]|nr:DUF881 domain-containing protein [Clostridiales bacterium]